MKRFRCLFVIPAILVVLSSCQEGKEEAPGKPLVPGKKPQTGQVAPLTTQPPSPATLRDQETLETKSYYTEPNLAEANALIEKLSPKVKKKVLAEMKARRKVSAVKILREEGDFGLAICKLTVELLAIRAEISAGF